MSRAVTDGSCAGLCPVCRVARGGSGGIDLGESAVEYGRVRGRLEVVAGIRGGAFGIHPGKSGEEGGFDEHPVGEFEA